METKHYKIALKTLEKMICKERVKILNKINMLENLQGIVYYCERCEISREANLSGVYYCSNCNVSFCEDCTAGDEETESAIISCDECEEIFCRECAKGKMANDFKCNDCV